MLALNVYCWALGLEKIKAQFSETNFLVYFNPSRLALLLILNFSKTKINHYITICGVIAGTFDSNSFVSVKFEIKDLQ